MGKEHDVLQAAQNGNVSKLESLFTQRQPKVLAGLFKGPNINWRDDSGCTALHLAALNGHNIAVLFLLQNDASANIPDNAGSFPLHLAAFNGHHEVAKTLLTQGPSRAQVNEPNMAGDTALHIAAQYGHQYVVQALVENHADLHIRNTKEETPLDLAAQYGRISTVQLFLVCDSKLLQDAVHKHSPLHLAARNGHEDIVNVLLDGGMPVNATCDMGTALHCAALYGKVGVAKLLLQRGIDIDIEDDNNEKVLDLLCKHPSQRSQEITALVYELSATGLEHNGNKAQSTSKERHQSAPESQKHAVRPSGYDIVPPPRPRPKNLDADNDYDDTEEDSTYSVLHGPVSNESNRLSNGDGNDFDLASITPVVDSSRESFFVNDRSSSDAYCLVGAVSSHKTTTDESSVKQFRRPSTDRRKNTNLNSNSSNQPTAVPFTNSSMSFSSKPLTSKTKLADYNQKNNNTESPNNVYQVPPNSNYSEKRASGAGSRSSIPDFPPPSPGVAATFISNTISTPSDQMSNNNKQTKMRSQTLPIIKGNQGDHYDNVYLTNIGSPDIYDNVNLSNNTTQDVYDNVNLNDNRAQEAYDNVNLTKLRTSSYDNVHISNKKDTVPAEVAPVPTQDSYYQSPPCSIIQEKPSDLFTKASSDTPQYSTVKTKSMKQKRTATITKREISLENIDETKSVACNDTVKTIDKNNEIYNANTAVKESSKEIEKGHLSTGKTEPNEEKSTVVSEQPKPKPRKQKQNRTSVKSVSSGYRMSSINLKTEINETYEWSKIENFLTDLEQYAEEEPEKNPSQFSDENVMEWLTSLKLPQYEPMFLTNGFDDINFLNGLFEDNDLIELGILDAGHRKLLIDESKRLPKPAVLGDDVPIPATVSEWLRSLKLGDYESRFIYNGYDNMDRVRVVWELELVTVLDMTTLGHRKRMLISLGRRPPVIKSDVSWAQRFADADAGKVRNPINDNSMEIACQLLETAESLKVDMAQRQLSRQESAKKSPAIPPRTDLEETDAPVSKTSKSTEVDDLVGTALAKTSNWKHCADTLLYESVSYVTQYLGSHPVQTVRGVSSTLEACNKMKSISKNVNKMPSITLSISVRGIDYIDSNSKMIISRYGINHISFCAQDPKDLTVFAYITRDEHTRKNYCHVFRGASVNLADEIIMTIGQCFELAYEQYVAMVEMQQMKDSLSKPVQAEEKSGNASSSNKQKPKGPPPKPKPYAERMAKKNDFK